MAKEAGTKLNKDGVEAGKMLSPKELAAIKKAKLKKAKAKK